MTACDSCGNPLAPNARVCPHCGHRFRSIVPVLVLIVGVLAAFAWLTYHAINPMP